MSIRGMPRPLAHRPHRMAHGLASLGRGGDSMLVHMSPGEVAGLQKIAMAHGGSLTINPETGLPEAGFLSSILPTIAGGLLSAMVPGLGALGAAAIVGGEEAIRNKNLGKGLMAGLGAYGGAGLAGSASEAGLFGKAASLPAPTGMSDAAYGQLTGLSPSEVASQSGFGYMNAPANAMSSAQYAQLTGLSPSEVATQGALLPAPTAASPSMLDKLKATYSGLGKASGLSNLTPKYGNLGTLYAAAAPMMAYQPSAGGSSAATPKPKYYVAAPGYSSLYRPGTVNPHIAEHGYLPAGEAAFIDQGWNPGVYVDKYPGLKAGGEIKKFEAGGDTSDTDFGFGTNYSDYVTGGNNWELPSFDSGWFDYFNQSQPVFDYGYDNSSGFDPNQFANSQEAQNATNLAAAYDPYAGTYGDLGDISKTGTNELTAGINWGNVIPTLGEKLAGALGGVTGAAVGMSSGLPIVSGIGGNVLATNLFDAGFGKPGPIFSNSFDPVAFANSKDAQNATNDLQNSLNTGYNGLSTGYFDQNNNWQWDTPAANSGTGGLDYYSTTDRFGNTTTPGINTENYGVSPSYQFNDNNGWAYGGDDGLSGSQGGTGTIGGMNTNDFFNSAAGQTTGSNSMLNAGWEYGGANGISGATGANGTINGNPVTSTGNLAEVLVGANRSGANINPYNYFPVTGYTNTPTNPAGMEEVGVTASRDKNTPVGAGTFTSTGSTNMNTGTVNTGTNTNTNTANPFGNPAVASPGAVNGGTDTGANGSGTTTTGGTGGTGGGTTTTGGTGTGGTGTGGVGIQSLPIGSLNPRPDVRSFDPSSNAQMNDYYRRMWTGASYEPTLNAPPQSGDALNQFLSKYQTMVTPATVAQTGTDTTVQKAHGGMIGYAQGGIPYADGGGIASLPPAMNNRSGHVRPHPIHQDFQIPQKPAYAPSGTETPDYASIIQTALQNQNAPAPTPAPAMNINQMATRLGVNPGEIQNIANLTNQGNVNQLLNQGPDYTKNLIGRMKYSAMNNQQLQPGTTSFYGYDPKTGAFTGDLKGGYSVGQSLTELYQGQSKNPYSGSTAQVMQDPVLNQPKVVMAHGGMIGYAQGGLGSFGGTYAAGGKLLNGPGDGMSDSIPAVIGGQKPQRAALADGEFVIPADVVSHLGNGSTKAGSQKLYAMMDKVRMARTGNKKQGKQINPDKFLPA